MTSNRQILPPSPPATRRREARWARAALLALVIAVPSAAAAADGATLTVVVDGIAESAGDLLVNVFTSATGWPKPRYAFATARVPATASGQEIRFEGLPAGPCAVTVVHDLDGNGKLTMRWFPWPRPAEPTGASNGARGSFGPPSFEAARFVLPADGARVRVALGK